MMDEEYNMPETLIEVEEHKTLNYLVENNILEKVVGISITSYDASCGTDVAIPNTINNFPVIYINYNAFYERNLTSVVLPNKLIKIDSSSFDSNKLTNIVIPNSLTTIGYDAFSNNLLTKIEIPSSVLTIQSDAFRNNQLTDVSFAKNPKLVTIKSRAFTENSIDEVTIPDTVKFLDCYAFDDTTTINKNESLTCEEEGGNG